MWCCLHNRYKGVLDLLFPEGVDIAVDYSSWEAGCIAFGKHNKTVKYIHGDPEDNPDFLEYLTEIKDVLPLYNKTVCVSGGTGTWIYTTDNDIGCTNCRMARK
jgi:hypothetical protein